MFNIKRVSALFMAMLLTLSLPFISFVKPELLIAEEIEFADGFYDFLYDVVVQTGYQKAKKVIYDTYAAVGLKADSAYDLASDLATGVSVKVDDLYSAIREKFESLSNADKNALMSLYDYGFGGGSSGDFGGGREGVFGGGYTRGGGAGRKITIPKDSVIDDAIKQFDDDFSRNVTVDSAVTGTPVVMYIDEWISSVLDPLLSYAKMSRTTGVNYFISRIVNNRYVTIHKAVQRTPDTAEPLGYYYTYSWYFYQGLDSFNSPTSKMLTQAESSSHSITARGYISVVEWTVPHQIGDAPVYSSFTTSSSSTSGQFAGKYVGSDCYYIVYEPLPGSPVSTYPTEYYVYAPDENFYTDPDYDDELKKVIQNQNPTSVINITINNYYPDTSPTPTPTPTPPGDNDGDGGIVSSILDLIKTLVETVGSLLNSVVDSIGGFADSVVDAIGGFANSVVSAIDNIVTNLIDALKDLIIYLFVLPDGVIEENMSKFSVAINEKIPYVGQVLDRSWELIHLFESYSDNDGGAEMRLIDPISTEIESFSSNGDMPKFEFTLPESYGGGTYSIIDLSYFHQYRSFMHSFFKLIASYFFIRRVVRRNLGGDWSV